MAYSIKELYLTLQGEGAHAGRVAVFVRFAGCNLWSGRDRDRERDAAGNGARCPLFCDTDFVGGDRFTAKELAAKVQALGAGPDVFVVLTGGEPLLQVDAALLAEFEAIGAAAHVETNGTVRPTDEVLAGLRWITLSPKVAPSRLVLQRANELKVVVPSYDPLSFGLTGLAAGGVLYVQPEDGPDAANNLQACLAFVQANPKWRLSVQIHKIIGVP